MKIIKRNGAEVPFDITKIITAVTKASDSVGGKARLSREQITDIAAAVTDQCQALNRAVSVEEVQDMVETSSWTSRPMTSPATISPTAISRASSARPTPPTSAS